MLVEVDVQPLAARDPRVLACHGDELGADVLTAGVLRDHRVLDERVDEAVPQHVHETHEGSVVGSGDDPAQAVHGNEPVPVPFQAVEDPGLEGLRVQLDSLRRS